MLAKQCLPPLSAMLAVALVGTTVLAAPDAGSVPPTPTPASAPARSTITVRIQGLRHDRGLILVALYDNEEAFAKKSGHVAAAETPAKHGGAVVVFDAVKPGRYALAFFQDENGNKKLDTSFLGIPTEAPRFRPAGTSPLAWMACSIR